MALCKTGNLRVICSQGYETPVVNQAVSKLTAHTGATRLRSHCSCVQTMVFWEWCHEAAGSQCHRARCHVMHGWSRCEQANLKYSLSFVYVTLKWDTQKLVHIPWQPSRQATRKAWSRCWTCRRASTLEVAAASWGARS